MEPTVNTVYPLPAVLVLTRRNRKHVLVDGRQPLTPGSEPRPIPPEGRFSCPPRRPPREFLKTRSGFCKTRVHSNEGIVLPYRCYQMCAIPTPPNSFCDQIEREDSCGRGRTRHRQARPTKRGIAVVGSEEHVERMDSIYASQTVQRPRVDLSQTRQPQLNPPSPDTSRSRKRSPSPIRQQTQSLKDTGIPRVVIQSENIGINEDHEARGLWKVLREAANGPVIPVELQVCDHQRHE